MPLSDIDYQVSSADQKQHTKQQHGRCEDCGKYISDKISQFQSEIHLQKNQQRIFSQDNTQSGTASLPSQTSTLALHTATLASHIEGVEIIRNEET